MEPLQPLPLQPESNPPAYINRRGWLAAFGVLELLIALTFLGMGLMVLLIPQEALKKAQEAQQPGAPQVSMLAVAVFYAAIATVWAVVGIGTLMAKNWARIASLVLSYFWIVSGVLGILVSALIMPQILKTQPNMPSGSTGPVLLFTLGFMAIIMVLVPGIFLLFFHNRNVKATCLASGGWVESKRPVVMLVLIAFYGLTLVCLPFNFFLSYPILIFGSLLTGAAKAAILVLMAGTEGVSLWGYLRNDLRGYFVALVTTCLWTLSTIITISRGSLLSYYQRMGIDIHQMPFFQNTSFLTAIWSFTVLFMLGKLAAIVYSRRYFPASVTAQ